MSRSVFLIHRSGNHMKIFDLTGRVVLLTGAAGHLGSETSRAILAAGAELIGIGRSESRLIALRESLPPDIRNRFHVVACDVTDINTPVYLQSVVEQRFGRLHGIVNNAYAGKVVGAIGSIDAEDFFTSCANNLVAPFLLIKTFVPLLEMSAKDLQITASVVNVASMYGTVSPDPAVYADSGKNNPIHYGATKGGMIQMTRYLACHLGKQGIRVNSIAPGPFPNTELDLGIPGFYDKLAQKVPMGRVGKPEEVAGPVVFLLSDAASYMNGANLPIDGGWTAW
jgi:NAD(P)-dependent dehydrogenase (short-subunit alcohol dehydrogenase family)